MDLLSSLALLLLCLVGYSCGTVSTRYKYHISPGILDIFIIAIMWTGALLTRSSMGRWWAILIWLFAGFIIGALISLFRRNATPIIRPKNNETSFIRRTLENWKAFAITAGNFQGRVLLIYFYFLVVTPFGLITRFASDPLHTKNENENSFWRDYSTKTNQMEEARKQY